jgi:hypothetical protein
MTQARFGGLFLCQNHGKAMPVSLSGLDLSWLNDPANRLPPEPKKPRPNYAKPAQNVATPYFIGDIKPFVNVVTRDLHEISSRSQLREFEKRSGYRQVGNDFEPGSIAKEKEAQKAEWERLAATVDHGWTDFDG